MIASENFVSSSIRLVKSYPYHFHEDLVILKVLKGYMSVKVLSNEYILKNDDVIIFNVGEIHSVEGISEVNLVMLISINQEFCHNVLPDFEDIIFQCNSVKDGNKHKEKFDGLNNHIKGFINDDYSWNAMDKIERKARNLLEYLKENFDYIGMGCDLKRFDSRIESRYKKFYKNALKVDGEMFSWKLGSLCKKMNLSYSHLRKDIKERYGISFRNLRYRFMIEHASRLILSSDETITEIGLKSGFSDPKYLIKYTKEFYGLTPSQLRNYSNLVKNELLTHKTNEKVNLLIDLDNSREENKF